MKTTKWNWKDILAMIFLICGWSLLFVIFIVMCCILLWHSPQIFTICLFAFVFLVGFFWALDHTKGNF